MATALFNNFLNDDAVIAVNASGTALTVTKGDYVAFSGLWAIAANTGVAGWKTSGVGIAMGNNPWWIKVCHFAKQFASKISLIRLMVKFQIPSQAA